MVLSRKTAAAIIVGILVLAVVLRALYLFELKDEPGLKYPPVDSGFTLYWARGIATGEWQLPPDARGRDPGIHSTAYLRPPGYAFFLAGMYRVASGHPVTIRAMQMVPGLMSVIAAWMLGRRMVGDVAGLLWAALMAANWTFIYFEGGLHGASAIILLVLVLFLCLERYADGFSARWAGLAGLLVGFIALIRPNMLLLAPLFIGWGWWAARQGDGVKRIPGAVSCAVVAGALVIAPALIRNYRVEGQLVPISGNAGITMYAGNNDAATGVSSSTVAGLGIFSSPWQMQDVRSQVSKEVGSDLTFSQASRELGRRAILWMVDNPQKAAALIMRKAALFWGRHEIAHNGAIAADRASSAALRMVPMPFLAISAGGLVGLGLLAFRWRKGTFVAQGFGPTTRLMTPAIGIFVVGWFVSYMPFFVASLYRAPIIPFLLLGCSVVILEIIDALRVGRMLMAFGWALAVSLVAVMSFWLSPRVDSGFDKRHTTRGVAFAADGQARLAVEEFRSALQLNPSSWVAHAGLGAVLLDQNQLGEAERELREAVRLQPFSSASRYNLGLVLAKSGAWEDAAEEFSAVVDVEPRNSVALTNLGVSQEAAGHLHEAVLSYERAIECDAKQRTALNNLAWILATDSRFLNPDRAVEMAERILSPDVNELDTLAAAYASVGRFDDALHAIDRALELVSEGNLAVVQSIRDHQLLFRSGQRVVSGEGANPENSDG